MECYTCKSNSGEKRISPGPIIHEGQYWLVENAYPIKRMGWLVLILKRHVEALHELVPEEFMELAQIGSKLIPILHEELHSEKEYISCYAEMEHFQYIHLHVFAKPYDLLEELKGGKSFALLKVSSEEAVSPEEIVSFCELLRKKFSQAA